uniref:IS66 family transposase n=1 Tax=Rhizobium sp. T1473 TaxID=555321 RepID=UPI00403F78CA
MCKVDNMVTAHGADHRRLRGLLSRSFTPSRIAMLALRIEQCVDRLLAEMAQRGGSADLMSEFAIPLPTNVIAELFGLPDEQREEIVALTYSRANTSATAAEVRQTRQRIPEFFRRLIALKRGQLGDDLASALILARDNGELVSDTEPIDMSKLGEDVTETLEEIPRRFKVIETVREKFTCRDCESISQPPAPFHATPRGFIGPHLLATILFDKFGMHSPLNRQSTRFKSEGIELSTSTLADQVGFGTAALMPVFDLIEAHVFAAERLHGDDTTIPIQAKDKCTTGRIWTYVCDDLPFGGAAPPAAIYYASSNRRGEHPQKHLAGYGGILQSDCYNGFEPLSVAEKKAVPITFAFCHAHARRKFFELADIQKSARDRKRRGKPISPIALEAVQRYDALFEIERQINGLSAEERLAARQEKSKPLFDDMHEWLKQERATLSRSSEVIEPIDYMLKRWDGFAGFLEDGRICLTNNAAERALRGIALGGRNWTFAGSQRGADRAAIMLTFITTCRLNDVDPKAWLADVFARIADLPVSRLHELLPWTWKRLREAEKAQDQYIA